MVRDPNRAYPQTAAKSKAAIETGNSFVVAKASAMASNNLPRYDDGARQSKVESLHSPGNDEGCFEFVPPKIGYDRDYDDSPKGEGHDTGICVLCARAPPGARLIHVFCG